MIITLNMTLCYKESKEEVFFKEQLGQKPKGHWESLCQHDLLPWETWDALQWPEQMIWALLPRRGSKLITRVRIFVQYQQSNLHQNVCTPCARRMQALPWELVKDSGERGGLAVSSWCCLDGPRYGGDIFFSFSHSSCTKVKAPLQLYSSSIRILAQNLAGPMAAVVKNAFPEEWWEFTDGVFWQG